jgi:hypothetical protein
MMKEAVLVVAVLAFAVAGVQAQVMPPASCSCACPPLQHPVHFRPLPCNIQDTRFKTHTPVPSATTMLTSDVCCLPPSAVPS